MIEGDAFALSGGWAYVCLVGVCIDDGEGGWCEKMGVVGVIICGGAEGWWPPCVWAGWR